VSNICSQEHIIREGDIDCIIVFDELVNYTGFDGDKGELKAFYEFITENKVDYEWNYWYVWLLSQKCNSNYSFNKLIKYM
jgi:hypothetical protein